MYKNQLQELSQRSCLNLPSYTSIREGPDHAPRFKVVVNFNGKSFESPSFCTTLRQADPEADRSRTSSPMPLSDPKADRSGAAAFPEPGLKSSGDSSFLVGTLTDSIDNLTELHHYLLFGFLFSVDRSHLL